MESNLVYMHTIIDVVGLCRQLTQIREGLIFEAEKIDKRDTDFKSSWLIRVKDLNYNVVDTIYLDNLRREIVDPLLSKYS